MRFTKTRRVGSRRTTSLTFFSSKSIAAWAWFLALKCFSKPAIILRTASVSSSVRCLPSGFSFLGEGSIAVVKCRWEWRWRRDGEERLGIEGRVVRCFSSSDKCKNEAGKMGTFFPNWFCHLLINCCNHFKCANHFLVYYCIVIVIAPWKWDRKKQTEKTIGFILITTRRNPSESWDGIGLANSMCSSGNKLNFFFFFSGAICN